MNVNVNELINQFCREFRTQRDKILEMSSYELKEKLDEFWAGLPWYVRLFRKQIMGKAYKAIKKL